VSGARVIPLESTVVDELDDAALVEAVRRGAPGAERLAWFRFGPMVTRTLYRLAGPGCDEEDLSQEVFLRFFRKVGRLREAAAIRPYLTGICIRVVRRELRRRWLRRWLRLTSGGDVPDVPAPTADPESRQVVEHYYDVLDRLSADARSLFVARHIEGLTLAEVAALHGLSVSTAQRKLARARGRIAALAKSDPVLRAYLQQSEPA
jgi:RNA polymerase sigma-70 factor (ECF subfamily)